MDIYELMAQPEFTMNESKIRRQDWPSSMYIVMISTWNNTVFCRDEEDKTLVVDLSASYHDKESWEFYSEKPKTKTITVYYRWCMFAEVCSKGNYTDDFISKEKLIEATKNHYMVGPIEEDEYTVEIRDKD